jgi:hypothetical protein
MWQNIGLNVRARQEANSHTGHLAQKLPMAARISVTLWSPEQFHITKNTTP